MIPEAGERRALKYWAKGTDGGIATPSKELLQVSGFEAYDSLATMPTKGQNEDLGVQGGKNVALPWKETTCVARWLKAKEKPHRDV